MTTIAATFSRHTRRPRTAYRTYPRPSLMKRFRYFIEYSGWDEKILTHEERANRICAGVIIASIIYFVPVFIKVFLR